MKKMIAAVDDNEDLLFTIKYGLTKLEKNFDIVTFNDPEKFLDEAKKQKFDLILLDIMMPKINGWDTFAKISKIKKNINTPVIFLTAKTDKQSQILGTSAATDFITKPFKTEELAKAIKKHLK